ncbi:MAG: hypothetical protein H0U12_07175 [Thermoleophilaceae bacterium]|nr:hypothetical protein [Thermoleophilaceae bacterium]
MPKPLEGGIAKIVAKALKSAKMTKAATLTKLSVGTRMPGVVTAGTNPTSIDYKARGIVTDYRADQVDGTLIQKNDRQVRLVGATIAGGQVPVPSDKVTIEGATYTVIYVSRDPAAAMYVCQVRA